MLNEIERLEAQIAKLVCTSMLAYDTCRKCKMLERLEKLKAVKGHSATGGKD